MSSDDAPDTLPLSRARAKLARPRGYKRVEALVFADDAPAAVAALSTVELYQLVREVGFADAGELIALATPEQIRGCIDLDVWDRDRFQTAAIEPWLVGVIDAGFEKLGQVWAGLDSELTALLLARYTQVYDLSMGEEIPDDEDRPLVHTPDTFFALAITSEDEATIALVHRLIEDLYRADLLLPRHTIMAARSEPLAELEEMSYRWRAGRVADLGYADFYEALEVFRPIDPGSVAIGEGTEDRFGYAEGDEAMNPGELPVRLAERVVGRSFLARALAKLGATAEADRIEAAFVVLVNKVLSALRVQPGETEAVERGSELAVGTVALGLEILSRGDVALAADALRTVSLTRVHRLGYSATLRLSGFARAVAPRAVLAGAPTDAVLEALLAQRPLYSALLDDPPVDQQRPFESLGDIRRAAECLTLLALRIAIAEAFGANLLARASEAPIGIGTELDDYARTALARALSGGAPTSSPLSDAELRAVLDRAVVGGALTMAARAAALAALDRVLDEAGITTGRDLVPALAERWLTELEDALGGLSPDDIDARFLAGIIAEASRQ
ncbi:MAG TPA: DUF6178 family protein [Kofleriaceae bacterium]|nr:DUF6178 family protein [Kofleriaceae bacterium]